MGPDQNNKFVLSDMAAAAGSIDEYSGNDNEDGILWIKEFEMIIKVSELTEK